VRSGSRNRRNRFIGDLRVIRVFGIIRVRIDAFIHEHQRHDHFHHDESEFHQQQLPGESLTISFVSFTTSLGTSPAFGSTAPDGRDVPRERRESGTWAASLPQILRSLRTCGAGRRLVDAEMLGLAQQGNPAAVIILPSDEQHQNGTDGYGHRTSSLRCDVDAR